MTALIAAPGDDRRWWHSRAHLPRFVADLLCDEIQRLRPGAPALPVQPWSEDLRLDEGGLGLDSLERLSAATALTEALHLRESGLEDGLLARRRFADWVKIARAGLEHFDGVMTFRTSGTNGTPKACSHSLAMLTQETAFLATVLPRVRRIVFTVPGHHIYGFLFTILLPRHFDGVDVIDARLMTPQALLRRLSEGDLLVSHPAHWALLSRVSTSIPGGVIGVTSTAPCPDELAAALGARGLDQLIQIYGSTETCGVG